MSKARKTRLRKAKRDAEWRAAQEQAQKKAETSREAEEARTLGFTRTLAIESGTAAEDLSPLGRAAPGRCPILAESDAAHFQAYGISLIGR